MLFQKKKEPPATLQGLRRRAQGDRDVFLRVMRSRGWYDGTVEWHIDSSGKKAKVEMKVERGTRYRITRFEIDGLPPETASLATPEGLASLNVTAGNPALAETVLTAENAIIAKLAEHGYPYAELSEREARIDRHARTMEVVVQVDAGPRARFGDVTVEGIKDVQADFVQRRLKFRRGEDFSPAKIEESRKTLFATGVFSAVTFAWGKRTDVSPEGLAPIKVVVVEGKMHSVGAGLKYSSADGPGGRAFWENRNVSGRADRVRTEVEYAEQEATGGISYKRPDWLGVTDQSLLLDGRALAEDFPAYERYALVGSSGVERLFSKHLAGTAGLSIEQSDVNSKAEPGGSSRFTLIGVPLGLRYDGSDSLLDPAHGHRTLLSVTPFVSVLGESVQILVSRATESFYVPLRKDHRLVWATRLQLGSVVGAERNEIPADKRMYAGGGDSVRGYRYQFVGPLRNSPPEQEHHEDLDNHNTRPPLHSDDCDPPDIPGRQIGSPNCRPIGGRSLLQAGAELRWKVTDHIGLVPFVEGAGVYESPYPDFGEEFLWSAGLGFRYFTIAGPIRFDVGVPLNPRQPDHLFEIYISLGQAF